MQYITGTLYRRLTASLLLSGAGRNHRGGYKAVRPSVGFWEPFHRWPPPGWRAVESGRVGGLRLRTSEQQIVEILDIVKIQQIKENVKTICSISTDGRILLV